MRPPAPAAPPVPEGPLRVDAVVPAPDGSAWRIRAGGSVLGRVDLDVPAELGLTPGRVLDRAAADGLRAALLRRAAYEAGLRLLGRRPQTKAALRARLRARFGEEAAARAEERLAAHLDDGAFAAAWIEERLRLRPLGAAALQAGL